ncbi:MAG: MBL fold metallo-hydrolase [Planctomycetota bacterium]
MSDHEHVTAVPLGPFQTNAYIVTGPADPSVCWIVDPGMDPGPLVHLIHDRGLTPQGILLTHAHLDHIAGIPDVQAAFGELGVRLHELEHRWPGDPELNLSAGFGLPISIAEPTGSLTEGDQLELAGLIWDVSHTPGHSPGSVTLYCAEIASLIAGDTLFAGSIGRHDFPTSDGEQLFDSIRTKIYSLPDETRVLPGHGPETTVGQEKHANPFVRP